jgi:bisphosphoglycerate-independent phosphoglycerate mutase (AlkP superfamily)
MMWVRTPERRHGVVEEQIPLTSVAPTILEMYGLQAPTHMSAEPVAA